MLKIVICTVYPLQVKETLEKAYGRLLPKNKPPCSSNLSPKQTFLRMFAIDIFWSELGNVKLVEVFCYFRPLRGSMPISPNWQPFTLAPFFPSLCVILFILDFPPQKRQGKSTWQRGLIALSLYVMAGLMENERNNSFWQDLFANLLSPLSSLSLLAFIGLYLLCLTPISALKRKNTFIIA